MTCFRDFTLPYCRIFGGNLLLLITILFYMAWWTVVFRPERTGMARGAGTLIALAVLTGAAAVTIKFSGILLLSDAEAGTQVLYILLGALALYLFLLALTRIVFQRPVTAELLLIILWAGLELSAVAALKGSGRLDTGQSSFLTVLLALATGVGIVCYVLYYRLDEVSGFWNGLIPLIVDAGVVTVFLVVLAVS